MLESNIVYIYSLTCPITGLVKYIGKTKLSNLNKRIYNHTKQIKNEDYYVTPCDIWSNKLILDGNPPLFKLVEVSDINNYKISENYWINHYGIDNLHNVLLSGEGPPITENHISIKLKELGTELFYGKDKSEKLKKIKSDNAKGEKNPNFGGKLQTEEYMKKQSVSNSKRPILIIDIITGEEFKFLNSKEASKSLNLNDGLIRNAKKNNYKIKKRYIVRDLN